MGWIAAGSDVGRWKKKTWDEREYQGTLQKFSSRGGVEGTSKVTMIETTKLTCDDVEMSGVTLIEGLETVEGGTNVEEPMVAGTPTRR